MNKSEMIERLERAMDEARHWAESGWTMTFGRQGVRVASLAEARAQPVRFVNRQEALAYWRCVAEAGEECAVQGEKAKAALERGDLRYAEGAVYFAVLVEKRLNKPVSTWEPVLAGMRMLTV
ncbi:MAG: hypothetical protein G8237_01810 [Magnetococcales bacterium]|nr:hypothetical protein [Magnetococcales bacterium]NGZ05069.1 hypothetical protein [Magnetococcales bacterium]